MQDRDDDGMMFILATSLCVRSNENVMVAIHVHHAIASVMVIATMVTDAEDQKANSAMGPSRKNSA